MPGAVARNRLRRKRGSRLLGSSIQVSPRAASQARSASRPTPSSGRSNRISVRSEISAIPAKPSSPLPLAARIAIVSR
jgi:hypothetical protein